MVGPFQAKSFYFLFEAQPGAAVRQLRCSIYFRIDGIYVLPNSIRQVIEGPHLDPGRGPILLVDLPVDFMAIYRGLLGRLDPQPNLFALHIDDKNFDLVADGDLLPDLSG
jgi:hypothetical protein